VTIAEATELRNFWCAMGELRQAVTDGAPQDLIDYHLDELLGTELHTKNELLRQRCIEARLQYGRPVAANIA
jgi:hypothetical protein